MTTSDGELTKTLPIRPGMTIVGKYRIERLIAAGGMGAVLQAHHEVLDQTVAIKLMRPELASLPEASQRFLREARAAARIESDFVARVTDVDLWEQTPFMVMEYLVGGDLAAVIDDPGVLTVSDAVDYAMQALAGLHAAHALGVIHRDLKPSNLFLVSRADGTKRLKILDFGISKVVGDDSEGLRAGANTSTQAMLGTPRYMSPEQVSSAKDVDVRTDLWAMGLILYELLTKSYPFEGESAGAILAAIITGEVTPARKLRRDVPVELEAVIAKLLEKNREARYPNARKVMRALAPFASRRIQALLLNRDELVGAQADTATHGTPSEVLSVAPAAAAAETVAVVERSEPTETETETTMSVAGVPKPGSGAARVIAAVVAATGLVALGLYLTRDDAPPMPSATTEPATPSASIVAASTPSSPTPSSPTPSSPTPSSPTPSSPTPSSAAPSSPAQAAPASPASLVPSASPRSSTARVVEPPSRPVPPPPRERPLPPTPTPRDLLNDWD